jgi:uncharacterized membrane protein YccC
MYTAAGNDPGVRVLVLLNQNSKLRAENQKLRAEVERLTFLHEQDHKLADRYQEHREAAESEVERLRAVLEKILDTALPSSTFRMPPYLVEAIKDALRDAPDS